MSKFVFFTKTDWREPPRLRHQLANLLVKYGHKVLFFEKPNNVFSRSISVTPATKTISFIRTHELLHHKLRVNDVLRTINAAVELNSIKSAISNYDFSCADHIVNFNYDYHFLRKLFPKNKLITIINDDFWCRALFGYEEPLKNTLSITCEISDVVLTVSEPLIEQLSQFCQPKLFLPWSDGGYSAIDFGAERKNLLFWGYINNRLNFGYIRKLADAILSQKLDITIDFTGPIQRNIDRRFLELSNHPCIVVNKPKNIDQLNFRNVLAAFIPYVAGNKADDVTSIPNKAFPMLSHGLPLLITGMPNFLKEPFVIRLGENINIEKDIEIIKLLPKLFGKLQPSISSFVNKNTEHVRYFQFINYFK